MPARCYKTGWLRAIVRVSPVSHLVTAERGLLSGHVAAAWLFGRPR